MNHENKPCNSIIIQLVDQIPATSKITLSFQAAPEDPDVSGPGKNAGELVLTNHPDGKQSVVISLGLESKVNLESFRIAGAAAARWCKKLKVTAAKLDTENLDVSQLFALFEGVYLGGFDFNRYKTEIKDTPQVTLYVKTSVEKDIPAIISRAKKISDAVNLARDWSHEPANIINPVTLAIRVEQLAKEFRIKCTILDEVKLSAIGAGGIMNVGKGSGSQPRMIILEYPGTGSNEKPVVLVGKALTFDTGGYSIKSVESIQGMKYDKCGGVDVIAVMMAASALNIKTPLVGIICAAENAISSTAYRPDDIITTLAGKTVEIITTDAEGRLVLADGLTYAQREFAPREIIDLATLTGGVVVALGRVRCGVMTNNDDLYNRLAAAGEKVNEKLWQLPLDDEYAQSIQGDDADLKNSGGREAHPIMGGIFLKQFVANEIPWAHMDIAAVSGTNKDLPYCPKGATGFGVRLLVEYLEQLG